MEDQNGKTARELSRSKIVNSMLAGYKSSLGKKGSGSGGGREGHQYPFRSSNNNNNSNNNSPAKVKKKKKKEEGEEEKGETSKEEKSEEKEEESRKKNDDDDDDDVKEKEKEEKVEKEEKEEKEKEEKVSPSSLNIEEEEIVAREILQKKFPHLYSSTTKKKKNKRKSISFKLFGNVRSRSNSNPTKIENKATTGNLLAVPSDSRKRKQTYSVGSGKKGGNILLRGIRTDLSSPSSSDVDDTLISSMLGVSEEDENMNNNNTMATTTIDNENKKVKKLRKQLSEREKDLDGKKKLIKSLQDSTKKREKELDSVKDKLSKTEKELRSKTGDLQFRNIQLKTLEQELEREKHQHRSLQKEIQKGRMKIFRVDDKELIKGEKIGEGAFGKVYEAQWNITRTIAIKEVALTPDITRQEILKEFQDQVSLVHPNILRVYGFSDPPGLPGERKVRILMEKMDVDLRKFLFRRKPSIALKFELMKKMVEGLHYLHSRDPVLLHRDVKSLNFLIKESSNNSNELEIKITDFGLMRTMQNSNTFVQTNRQQGTVNWMAPELLQLHPEYSVYSDIYALAITFYETLFEKFPYRGILQQVVYDEVKNKGLRPDLSDPKLPKPLRNLLDRMWSQEPRKRFTTKELLIWFDKNEKKVRKKYGKLRFPVDKK